MQNLPARFHPLPPLVQKKRKPAKNPPLVQLEWRSALHICAVMRTPFQHATADLSEDL
jgi:hypothetical protein